MFYKQLNGFRFIFVLMVMIQHWMPQWVYHYTHLGGIGVNLFFVLSGFLIGEILMREKEKTNSIAKSVKNFFMRRALRIFPVYYLTIAIYGVFFTTGGILIWNLTYTNNILECINVSRIPIEYSHLWSLCVEEQFYIFFPFLIFFTPRSKLKAVLIFAIVMSVLLRFGVTVAEYGDYNVIASRFTLMCVDCLFAGAFLAYLKTYRNETLVKIFNKKGLILPAIIVVAILHLVVRIYGTDLIYNTFFRFLSAMLGWLIIGYSVMVGFKGVLGRFVENKFIAEMGKVSYGIYLFHPFIQELYHNYFIDNPIRSFFTSFNMPVVSNRYLIDGTILFIATIGISFLSYNLFEARLLKLKSRFV